MPVFDTSALLPLFNQGHPHHAKAKKHFESADAVILHPSVVTEFTTVIRRLAKDKGLDGNERARQALVALLRQPRVIVRAAMDHKAVVDVYLSASRISFTDAVVAASGAEFDAKKPVTFDQGLARLRKTGKEDRARRRKEFGGAFATW